MIFAARLREAKTHAKAEWIKLRERNLQADHLTMGKKAYNPENDLESHLFSKDPHDMIRVKILPGMSHGFLQMCAFLPEALQAVRLTTDWYIKMFAEETKDDSLELTSLMLSELNTVDENAVMIRRRASLASRIGMTS